MSFAGLRCMLLMGSLLTFAIFVLFPSFVPEVKQCIANNFQMADIEEEVQACIVPRLSLATDTNLFAFKVMEPLECYGDQLFSLHESVLHLNRTALQNKNLTHCYYHGIQRKSENEVVYIDAVKKTFPFEFDIKHEYFTITCFSGSTQISTQIFAEHMEKKDVLERKPQQPHTESSDQLNILLLIVESMSHLSFERRLPKMMHYLETLNATILNAYNIIGEGTLAGLVPFLTGE